MSLKILDELRFSLFLDFRRIETLPLKTKKSPGVDSCIVAEVLKNGGVFIREEINKHMQ